MKSDVYAAINRFIVLHDFKRYSLEMKVNIYPTALHVFHFIRKFFMRVRYSAGNVLKDTSIRLINFSTLIKGYPFPFT